MVLYRVDISMAVTTEGYVYGWGKTEGRRNGLGVEQNNVTLPRRVNLGDGFSRAVDVECGYVNSLIIGVDGTMLTCGSVGVDGERDGENIDKLGFPRMLGDFNIWHRLPEPTMEPVKKERSKKYGKYEVKGRSQML